MGFNLKKILGNLCDFITRNAHIQVCQSKLSPNVGCGINYQREHKGVDNMVVLGKASN